MRIQITAISLHHISGTSPLSHFEGKHPYTDLTSKHMVSLRGSKFGSRVGMLCCNPAYATHPGPGVGLPTNRFASASNNGSRFSGAYR